MRCSSATVARSRATGDRIPRRKGEHGKPRRQARDPGAIAQYSYTYDAQDAEGFAALFTEDAVWERFASGATRPEIRLESRTAIRAWAAQRLRERRGRFTSRHYQSGILFDELTSELARTRTMVLVTHQNASEAAPRPTATGVYHDQWHKTSEGWRLVHRILRRDTNAK
jgi:hypothetical protein